MSRQYETMITIPVRYQNIPFTKNLLGSLPSHLDFYYRGSGFELFMAHVRDRPDSLVVDIAKIAGENNTLNLPSMGLRNQLPGELQPYRVVPETISQSFTTRAGKRIPVIAKTDISFRNRFAQSGKLILVPDSINIAGPDGLLETIHSVSTEWIRIDDVHENVFGSIYLSHELPKNLALSDPYVYYYLTVEELTEGEFQVPVELPGSQRSRVTLLPPVVKIRFQAELHQFRNIKPSDFQVVASVPFPELPAQLTLELKRRPKNIRNVSVDPRMVDYLLNE